MAGLRWNSGKRSKINLMKYILTAIVTILSVCVQAKVTLPRLVSNGMVLQRGKEIKIWGWADKNESVRLSFLSRNYEARADDSGHWQISLPAQQAGGPYQMVIKGDNELTIMDILIGEVWVCAGQSNMELPVRRVEVAYPGLVKNSENTNIRHFGVKTTYRFKDEARDFETGEWKAANPVNIAEFSAVGYFFAKSIYEKYKVPVGLITIAVGGSPAEAWLSESEIQKYPEHAKMLSFYQRDHVVDSIRKRDAEGVNQWNQQVDANDLGLLENPKWSTKEYDFSNWSSMVLPGLWKENPFLMSEKEKHQNASGSLKTNGVIWFKKTVNIAENQLNKPTKLILGALVDKDEVYFNGTLVGSTGYQYPPRRYTVPKEIIKKGDNTISVRLVSNVGRGGFVPDKFYGLTFGEDTLNLSGEWKYKVGYASTPMPGGQTTFHYQPSSLFNAMLAPIFNYKIAGVLWYQGESNTRNPKEYSHLFADMIVDWRSHFKQGDLPFLYVQLANFMEPASTPQESNWAELREVQRRTLRIPNTAMAVIIDIGEWNDIHPLNKKDVGERLALLARRMVYKDKNISASGPMFKSAKATGGQLILSFDEVGKGLRTKNSSNLGGFTVAGADKKFVNAKAAIKANKIIVWSEEVKDPKYVRYAWANNPENANLTNSSGLPASPFSNEED
jgi:sialate O-acetylesterase